MNCKYLHLALAAACSFPAAAQAPNPALQNAALARYGARIEAAAGAGARRDPSTPPESSFGGDVHTRQVMTGAPYTFMIRLPRRLPIARIDLADSDYDKELAPKDIEIRLDGGEPIRASLELKRPQRRRPDWQQVLVGREAQVVEIRVLSNHQPEGGANWGGIGEIAVLTTDDLEAGLKIPGYDAKAPTFVHVPALAEAKALVAKMPPRAQPGEHPCLLLTPAEVPTLRAELAASERGRAALAAMLKVADAALAGELNFPDPAGPQGQLRDRGDDVARRHGRLSTNCGTLGVAYTMTGEAKYARRAAEILSGYVERYELYPEHKGANPNDTGKVMAQRLSEAMWLIPLVEAFDAIHPSGALSDEQRKAIEEKLIRPALTFIRRKEPAAEASERDRSKPGWRSQAWGKAASNWLIFYNAATMLAGATLQDRDMIDLAAADLRALISSGVSEDGLWGEGAIGYQFFAMGALVPALEAAARQGVDLWSWDGSRAKKLFDSPLRYAYPDGTAPGINDSARATLGNWSTMSYDYAWLRWGDPAHAAMVNASPRQLHMSEGIYFPTRVYQTLPQPPATSFPSAVFGGLGYAILRGPSTYALMDYGPHGGVHGHRDKLNLILFAQGEDEKGQAKGDEIGGEPVFHRYEDPLHDGWTTQTVAHNTMAVDGKSQAATEGRLLVFEDTPAIKVMRAQSDGAYPGALLDRTVVVLNGLVLDVFHGRSAQPHAWDRTLRFQGTLDAMPTASPAAKPLGDADGFKHLQVLERADAAQLWRGTWHTSVGEFDVALAGAAGQSVALCQGPDKESVAVARQQGERADFATAYSMRAWKNPVRTLRRLQDSPQVSAFEAAQQDGTVVKVFVSHQAGEWQCEGWKSDARVLVVQVQRSGLRVLLCGGTFAQGSAGLVRLQAPGNALAAAAAGGPLAILSERAAGAAGP